MRKAKLDKMKFSKRQWEKGQYGYIPQRRLYEMIVSFVGFAVIALIYLFGLWKYDNNKNILTVMAIMLVLPLAKHVVAIIVLIGKKSLQEEKRNRVESLASQKQGYFLYDNVISSKEKLHCLPVMYIENKQVFAYDEQTGEEREWEKYIAQFLSSRALVNKVWISHNWEDFFRSVKAADYGKEYEKLTIQQREDRKENDQKIIQAIKDYSL